MDLITAQFPKQGFSHRELKHFIDTNFAIDELKNRDGSGIDTNDGDITPNSLARKKLNERAGELINSIDLQLPYDTGTLLEKTPVHLLNGDITPFSGILAEADTLRGELNLAVLMGKWFKWNYNPLNLDFSTFITNMAVCEMSKKIRFAPFDREVFAIARISAKLPENPVTTTFTGWERTNIFAAGIQADFFAELSWYDGIINHTGSVVKDTLIRSLKVMDNTEVGYIYKPAGNYTCVLKVPAGVREINFRPKLIGQAFTSNDINPLMTNGNINQYALSMLDLRNEVKHQEIDSWIIMNPLSGHVWRAPGGVKLEVKIDFNEIVNPDTF